MLQPLRRQFPEGHATLAAIALAGFDRALLLVVFSNQLGHSYRRALLIEIALRHSPTSHDPPAVVGRPLEPRWSYAALHLSPCAPPLGLVSGPVRAACNYERANRITAALLTANHHFHREY